MKQSSIFFILLVMAIGAVTAGLLSTNFPAPNRVQLHEVK